MQNEYGYHQIVMQPTPMCNLNCRYCYLPDRRSKHFMSPELASKVALDVAQLGRPITIIWHGGEPLAVGHDRFRSLLEPFRVPALDGSIEHAVQTNATLIDARWCDIFREYSISVGVSLDGPDWANINRVDWAGNPSFSKAVNGIRLLQDANIPFNVLVVVSDLAINNAGALYHFFLDFGCKSIGINIEEIEGINHRSTLSNSTQVYGFWRELFRVWRSAPHMRVREITNTIQWMKSVFECERLDSDPTIIDLLPTIAWNGDLTLLSPELAGITSTNYGNFVVGNVLYSDLDEVVRGGISARYVQDYVTGVGDCRNSCDYFSFCGGGHAGNKHAEYGTTNATITLACQMSKKALVNAILESL